jgi:hypothetical protein
MFVCCNAQVNCVARLELVHATFVGRCSDYKFQFCFGRFKFTVEVQSYGYLLNVNDTLLCIYYINVLFSFSVRVHFSVGCGAASAAMLGFQL